MGNELLILVIAGTIAITQAQDANQLALRTDDVQRCVVFKLAQGRGNDHDAEAVQQPAAVGIWVMRSPDTISKRSSSSSRSR